MRLIVFFDLPTSSKKDKREYVKFRKFLLKNGFFMLQFSVYSRVCKGLDSVANLVRKIHANSPETGNVRLMKVTEKQYAGMQMIVGIKKKNEIAVGEQLVLL